MADMLSLNKLGLLCVPLSVVAAIAVYVIRKKDKDVYDSLTEFKFIQLIVNLGFKLLKNRKQGELKIRDELAYTASGDAKFPLIISPRNHKIGVKRVRLDSEHIGKYKLLCGYDANSNVIPVCYAETIFMPVLMTLVSSDKFCLSPLGLIHIKQEIWQHDALEKFLNKELFAEAYVTQYRQGERGVEVDVKMRLMASRQFCVWKSVMTCLSRSSTRGQRSKEKEKKDFSAENSYRYQYSDYVDVSGDCGLSYAKLSGDWNPHHLYTWSAWLLGYKRPIAHGMWTLSRALAVVEKNELSPLSDKLHVTCEFKRPVFMPGRMRVQHDDLASKDYPGGCKILVQNAETDEPQLVASISGIAKREPEKGKESLYSDRWSRDTDVGSRVSDRGSHYSLRESRDSQMGSRDSDRGSHYSQRESRDSHIGSRDSDRGSIGTGRGRDNRGGRGFYNADL
ncbi:3-hydroxyacyl-thioester dehydratase X-like isoform X2 [Dreissena polymorpha]|uniref:3-hydroxyacyl-thioester dehydratase X-like isoform X2 n=1 Tax=Dreissena polymorpha TaxID=45954 RepID=UPI002263FE78|nr:3-hydroxyacyl-thioester dehydratase X-like isoform X2 [Dreissena polymorpha]